MANCSANTLLSTAASNGYSGLDDRSLKIAALQLLCSGGGVGGGSPIAAVSTIAYGTTITPDLGVSGISTTAPRRIVYRLTLTGNITTVAAPIGTAVDGDVMVWECIQDGSGSRTMAGFNSIYGFGTDITGITLTITASKRDFISWQYNSTAAKWYAVGFVRGY